MHHAKAMHMNLIDEQRFDDLFEVVERSSGYWVTDGCGTTEGPFDEFDDATTFINNQHQRN